MHSTAERSLTALVLARFVLFRRSHPDDTASTES
jgi:hypothetical protein